MRVLIFVNGIVTEYDWLQALVQDDDYLICADGGTYHCLACNRIPHIVVGDMDSLEPETAALLAAEGVLLERYPTTKNETDLELAINLAINQVAQQAADEPTMEDSSTSTSEILLLGVLGGRLDQMLANLLILAQREWPVPMRIVDREESAQLVRGGQSVAVHGHVGDTISAIPISPTVAGITYTGLLYPLIDATLHIGSTRGISNELAQESATITVAEGDLLLVHRH